MKEKMQLELKSIWFVCIYSENFAIFSNHIINLNCVIQAKPASQRSEYANVNFCAHLFIYTFEITSGALGFLVCPRDQLQLSTWFDFINTADCTTSIITKQFCSGLTCFPKWHSVAQFGRLKLYSICTHFQLFYPTEKKYAREIKAIWQYMERFIVWMRDGSCIARNVYGLGY